MQLSEAWCTEMAFHEAGSMPHFTHPQLCFVQTQILELRLASGHTFHITTAQDDDTWELWPRFVENRDRISKCEEDATSIFRTRQMLEFPLGRIGSVGWWADERENIQEISFCVNTHKVVLRSEEVYEDWHNTLMVRDRDESVLVFLERSVYAATVFNARVCPFG